MKSVYRMIFGMILLAILCIIPVRATEIDAHAASITVFKDYRYEDLTPSQKKICDRIMKDVRSSSHQMMTRTFTCTENDFYIVWNTINDVYFRYYGEIRMDVFRVYDNYTRKPTGIKVKINVKASRPRYERSQKNLAMLKKTAASLTKNRTKKKAIVLAINRYVCGKLTWKNSKGTLDEAIRSKYTKCTGYSSLFMALCELCDIPCCQVIGRANGEGHSWNQVWLSGKWYYIDPTWNDQTNNRYLLSEKRWSDHKTIYSKLYILNTERCGYA